ncbi:flagellar basal body P-ring formation chaperone FlgA [Nitrincola alkalilacustris]|uniref:flagellar basal body P-ring formation chaperone FlgA n=1 Tax=Nitrincola alkalilacustris TaxID=1571224 RepID=UPI001F0EB9EE|nr:flagellar basal body P-ring formation chaperone FlgA [Nitrincola alkalilacustris]
MFNLTLVIVLFATFLISPAFSATTTAEEIEQAVSHFITEEFQNRLPDSRIEVNVSPVNPTLGLPQCSHPLTISLPFNSGQRVTARASCNAPQWSITVTAQVRQFMTVVVAARPIVRHGRISAQDLKMQEQDISRLNQEYFTREQDLLGKLARRHIGSNQIITTRMLEAALAVNRGDSVAIEARRGGLVIRTPGVALEDGRINEQISVRNERSGIELRAVVVGNGVVRVP